MMAIAIFIYACRTDHLPENETSYNNSSKFQLTSKRISLNESKHKEKLITELDKAETNFKAISKTNVNGRIIDYGNGLSIDTDNAIYIENGPNYHTYTFNIKRENAPADAPIENLVLSPLTDGTYRELLFSYHLTLQEKQIFMNGGFVDTKNKVTVTNLEKGTFNSGGELARSQSQSCTIEINYYYTTCSAHEHSNGEQFPKCRTEQVSELVFVIREVCTPNQGGGEGGSPTPPCIGSGPLTGPQAPTSGIGYDSGDGCGGGIPTMPNPGGGYSPPSKDPCQKTKALLADPAVKSKIDYLEEKSKTIGEKAFLYMKDNTTSGMIDGGDHEVNITPYSGYKGIYHNHTPAGTYMFSVDDIITMFKTAVKQLDAATAKEAFIGMVAKETYNCPPDNFVYHNYLLRFNGDFPKAIALAYSTKEEKEKFEKSYTKLKMELLGNPALRNGPGIAANLNSQGLEQLLFGVLSSMSITPDQVVLQKIEKSGIVNNINLNTDGTTTPVPCP